jgi:hypothetical protein
MVALPSTSTPSTSAWSPSLAAVSAQWSHQDFTNQPPACMLAELRKEKAERAPGGVTPGEDPAYYAAVARANGDNAGPVQQVGCMLGC